MSLNAPGALYDPDLQDLPVMAKCDPEAMVWQEQALKTQEAHPRLTPVLNRTEHQYGTTWVKGVPISHESEVQVHIDHHLGVEGRLAAYELVGPTWQLNVINIHVPFGDATETFLEHLMEAYRQLAMMGPTVIIGDFNAAPSADDRGGRQTPEDTSVQMAMQHMGLQDLTTSQRGQYSLRTLQPGSADSCIDLCYADSAHVEVARAQYQDLPTKIAGHRPLEVQIKVLQVPPASREDMEHEEQPPIALKDEHHTHQWMAYYRTVQRILGQQDETDLNLAMRQSATACGLHEQHQTRDDATPHQDLRSLVTAIWRDKRALHTAVHSHNLQAQHDAQEIAARLDPTRLQLREWHVRRAKELAQEQQRYFQNPQPYKSLKQVDKVLGETGHRGIKAERLQDGTVTKDPKVVLEELLNSFLRQHNTEHGELSAYTEELISHVPKHYNRTQRRDMHRTPFTILEFDEVLYKLQPGRTPGVDGLPAELYRRLPLNLRRHLAARLWDIAIGKRDVPPDWANLVHPLYKKDDWANPDNWRPIVCATTEAKLIWMLILKRVAPAVYPAISPTMRGAIPGRSPLEAIFMQSAVVDMDPISLILTSLDVKGAFPNIPHRLLRAVRKHMGLPFQGFLQAYLATRMYAIKTDVGTTPWVHPASRVPQAGAEGPFLFLVVTLPLAFYIRRTYPDVAPYPLRTTLLAFLDDMAVVTTTARQPLSTTPDPTRATKVLQAVTNYLEGSQLLVHNVESATMVHNAPPPPLRPGDPPMNPVNTATFLGVQQAATTNGVTLPPNLIRQLTRTLVIPRIVALSTQALAYFLQAVLNAAIGFKALHLTHPQYMLQAAATTVRRAWTIHGHRPTSLPATVRAASPPYYGDNTDHLVNNAYTAHTAAHLHRVMHNHEPEVGEVFTLKRREAQYHRNTCSQNILHQRGLPTKVGTRVWNHLQLLLPYHQHVIQTNHRCRETGPLAILHTDVGGRSTGSTTTLDLMGTTLHLVRVTPNQMRALQRVGTHHVSFLQHPEWLNKSVLEGHMRSAATQTGHPKPTDGEVREAYNLFWSTHKRRLTLGPPQGNQAHHRPPEKVEYVPGTTVPAVLLLAPNGVKATLRPGRARGSLWMLPPPTVRPFCPPPLSQDKLRGTPTTCWRCGPKALATLWPILQLLARYHPIPTAHATPEQHRWFHPHFERAAERNTATVAWGPSAAAEWRFHRGTWDTKHPAITVLVLTKHRSTTPKAPAYPVKHRCSQVQDWQTVEWPTFHPQKAYLLQYVYYYLAQGHEENNDYVRMNPAATEIIRQGVGVYATRRLQPAATKPWATTERVADIHAYQPATPCRLPYPDEHNTVIFVDASGTTSLTSAAGGAALKLRTDATGRLRQHHLTGATIFGASSHGELKTLAIIVDAVNDTHQEPGDRTHHVWVVVDAVVDF